MSIEEKVQIDYDYLIEYLEDPQNAIGATTSTTLRTITAHNDGNSIYVRKFGLDYEITDVTDIEDPVDVNMKFLVYSSETDTLLGSRVGGGAFVDGGTVSPAEGCYLEIEASGGAVTVLATITIDTDVDAGGKTFICAAETVADGDTLRLYLSDTTSTYYDAEYKYGGARHSPDSSSALPWFDPETAVADPDVTGFTITTVLDSETYDQRFSMSIAGMILQADEGQTPVITSGVGARVTREVTAQYNNLTAIYFNEDGDDADAGTWQEPKASINNAITNRAGKNVIYGGTGATPAGALFTENFIIQADYVVESDYGYTPTIQDIGSHVVRLGASAAFGVYGLIVKALATNHCVHFTANATGSVEDNTLIGGARGIHYTGTLVLNLSIKRNEVYGSDNNGIFLAAEGGGSLTIEKNVVYDVGVGTGLNSPGIYVIQTINNVTALSINNNFCYGCDRGLQFSLNTGTVTGTISNNTSIFNREYGISWGGGGVGITVVVSNNIIYFNDTFDLLASPTYTITYSNYGTNSGWTIGSGNIITDPELCKTLLPYKAGISGNSGAYRNDSADDDMGAHFRIIEYNASNLEINGFVIDGQNYYNNAAYILDTANHINGSLKWCTIYDHQGIAVDLYDNDTDTAFTVSNCKIYDNGNGIKLNYGGNTVEQNIIYNNSIYGIYSERMGQTFDHNVFYGNQYGISFTSTSNAVIFKNSITHGNSLFGIFSEAGESAVTITYCCITDGTSGVSISDPSNFIDDPLFLNELLGEEDFNIKTSFGGFAAESPCFLASDDTPVKDIGAYDVNRSIVEEAWKKFVLDTNPSNLNDALDSIGQNRFGGALGSRSLWAKAHKLIFPFEWDENHYTTERQKDKIRYFTTIIGSREIGRTKLQSRLRLRLVPTAHLFDGTNGVIDASNKTLVDSAIDLNEWKYKGYNLAVIFTDDAGMVIDAGAKTGTKAGAGWTIDQWIGYYLKYNGYTYYIKSNTATILTLSDPYANLVSATIDYSIEKYFEILKHDETIYTLIDNDSELVGGTYDYYIDFALTRIGSSKFAHAQPRFKYSEEEWKTGYTFLLEQI